MWAMSDNTREWSSARSSFYATRPALRPAGRQTGRGDPAGGLVEDEHGPDLVAALPDRLHEPRRGPKQYKCYYYYYYYYY